MFRQTTTNEHGIILVVCLFLIALLMAAAAGTIFSTQSDLGSSNNFKVNTQAFYIADSGIQLALKEVSDRDGVNDFDTLKTTSGVTTLVPSTPLGPGSYSATVSSLGKAPIRL